MCSGTANLSTLEIDKISSARDVLCCSSGDSLTIDFCSPEIKVSNELKITTANGVDFNCGKIKKLKSLYVHTIDSVETDCCDVLCKHHQIDMCSGEGNLKKLQLDTLEAANDCCTDGTLKLDFCKDEIKGDVIKIDATQYIDFTCSTLKHINELWVHKITADSGVGKCCGSPVGCTQPEIDMCNGEAKLKTLYIDKITSQSNACCDAPENDLQLDFCSAEIKSTSEMTIRANSLIIHSDIGTRFKCGLIKDLESVSTHYLYACQSSGPDKCCNATQNELEINMCAGEIKAGNGSGTVTFKANELKMEDGQCLDGDTQIWVDQYYPSTCCDYRASYLKLCDADFYMQKQAGGKTVQVQPGTINLNEKTEGGETLTLEYNEIKMLGTDPADVLYIYSNKIEMGTSHSLTIEKEKIHMENNSQSEVQITPGRVLITTSEGTINLVPVVGEAKLRKMEVCVGGVIKHAYVLMTDPE